MGKTSFQQTSFLGGEWSPYAQGRMDSDHYKISLNLCTNYYPIESGALVRRMGTRFLGPTKGGAAGRVIGFDFSVTDPYQAEFTAGYMRIWQESGVVTGTHATISTISTATPAKVTATGSLPGDWATGDTVIFEFTGDAYVTVASRLRNWQFLITKTASTQFTLRDAVTGQDIDGTDLGGSMAAGGIVRKVYEATTVYTTDSWQQLRKVQDESSVVLLHPDFKPYALIVSAPFSISAAVFTDGPYLDQNTTTTTLTPSGTSGSITLTASSIVGINGGTGFQTTDVGRMIRVFSQPDTWLAASDYSQGDAVTWEGNWYAATRSVRAGPSSPAENVSSWAPVNDVAFWSWGRITARTSTTQVTVTVSGHALVNTNATSTWRLGLFCDTLGWPTCGCYHEGRLWLSGVIKNRIDGSKVLLDSRTAGTFDFSPTSEDGTVADDNAVAATANAVDANDIFWMLTEDDGLLFGTQAGEWRVRASNLDDPITPTSIQLRRVTTYGSFNSESVNTPRTVLFIQRKQRKVLEFTDAASIVGAAGASASGYYAPNLTLTADHLTVPGIAELAWMQEPTHMLWARREDGVVLCCPYMRAPEKYFAAWSTAPLGCDRIVESISVGPSDDGLSERLFMVTSDDDGVRHVQVTTEPFNAETPDWAGQFVDDAVTPSGSQLLSIANGDDIDGIRIFGLWPANGMSVAIVIGGLDLGDFDVVDGQVDVPFTADFTEAFLEVLTANQSEYGAFKLLVVDGA